MIGVFRRVPWKSRAEERLEAATRLLEEHAERLWKMLETPTERMIICTPDLCVWMHRKFRLQSRRYIRKGATRGLRILQLGWILLSFRY